MGIVVSYFPDGNPMGMEIVMAHGEVRELKRECGCEMGQNKNQKSTKPSHRPLHCAVTKSQTVIQCYSDGHTVCLILLLCHVHLTCDQGCRFCTMNIYEMQKFLLQETGILKLGIRREWE